MYRSDPLEASVLDDLGRVTEQLPLFRGIL